MLLLSLMTTWPAAGLELRALVREQLSARTPLWESR